MLFTVALRVCWIKGVSDEIWMQEKIMSAVCGLLAAKFRFSVVILQLSDGHVDGHALSLCAYRICMHSHVSTLRFCGSYIIGSPR